MKRDMENESKITLAEWDELTLEEKEGLRNWAIQHGYELDIVPGRSGSFDPVCEYAALLTCDQMVVFLHGHNQKVRTKSKGKDKSTLLWGQVIKQLRSSQLHKLSGFNAGMFDRCDVDLDATMGEVKKK